MCGAVRFRLSEAPTGIENCHCVDCRRASGAPFVTWGSVPREALEMLAGAPREIRHAGRIRSFAPCCGTALFFQRSEGCATIDVAIATLDAPERLPPEIEIWTEDRLPWIPPDPRLKSYPQAAD